MAGLVSMTASRHASLKIEEMEFTANFEGQLFGYLNRRQCPALIAVQREGDEPARGH
jgi:hypothetical protein